MAKPAGPQCNMRCGYCYYLEKKSFFPAGAMRMSEELLELYIRQRFAASSGPNTHFEWHGGEPTLLGIDYFRRIRELQDRYAPEGRVVTNGLQTNGLLLDEGWADFLLHEGFSVGLSLDGPRDLHDVFRTSADGGPTQARTVRAFRLLKERRVFCNILCVLHSANAPQPDRIYDFFRGLGAAYIQFLPLVSKENNGDRIPMAAEPAVIGTFLCRVFDRWIREDVGKMVIQNIDEALRPVYGIPHALCIHRETCGDVAVLEHDGSFFTCDHFVRPEYRIGNIRQRPLAELARDPAMLRFGRAKQKTLPAFCRKCEVLEFCNGGCPKDRTAKTPDGDAGLNCLCPAYKSFFLHSRPELTRLAVHMQAGKSLRSFYPDIS
jgi:uncharacterized protein